MHIAIVLILAGVGVVAVAIAHRRHLRRTLHVNTWARDMGMERMPGETNSELAERIATRLGIYGANRDR